MKDMIEWVIAMLILVALVVPLVWWYATRTEEQEEKKELPGMTCVQVKEKIIVCTPGIEEQYKDIKEEEWKRQEVYARL